MADREEEVRRLSEQGMTARQIEREMGMGKGSAQAIRTRIGLKVRRASPIHVRRLLDHIEIESETLGEDFRTRNPFVLTLSAPERDAVGKALRELRTELTRSIAYLESIAND